MGHETKARGSQTLLMPCGTDASCSRRNVFLLASVVPAPTSHLPCGQLLRNQLPPTAPAARHHGPSYLKVGGTKPPSQTYVELAATFQGRWRGLSLSLLWPSRQESEGVDVHRSLIRCCRPSRQHVCCSSPRQRCHPRLLLQEWVDYARAGHHFHRLCAHQSARQVIMGSKCACQGGACWASCRWLMMILRAGTPFHSWRT